MKISIENDEGQKVEFFAFKSFSTHIIKLSCECCETQDDIILNWFKANKGKEVSADDIWINLFDTSVVPQTSIRRSITTLTGKGLLEKLDKQKMGIYGRPVYLWKLN